LFKTDALLICAMLFAAMILMVIIGRLVRKKLWSQDELEPKGGVNSLLAALFGLFGFMLAFTFGMSGNRFENVRNIVVEEAGSIQTAILRADLYPDSMRNTFREDFRNYLEARIAYYENVKDPQLFAKAIQDSKKAAASLWQRTIQYSKQPNLTMQTNNMAPALNSMFTIATRREVILRARVPDPIVYMLFILALTISFLGGFTSISIRKKDWLLIAGFAILSTMIIYITIDLGRPMRGIIRPELGPDIKVELRNLLK
jgi:hypothetical protein